MISGRMRTSPARESRLAHINKTETFVERTRGLIGCSPLAEGHGLLIAPCNSIHTFFMATAIDVLFLDSRSEIIAMRPHLKPWRFAFCTAAAAVLELMPGQIALSGLQQGDRLIWEDVL